jgi:rhodanese-related sulfurtransferase
MEHIEAFDWNDKINNDRSAVIVDTRTQREWCLGAIKDSVLLDVLNPISFMNQARKLDKDKNYYLYCQTGLRSVQACMILENLGFKKTYNLKGGIVTYSGSLTAPERK